MIDTDVGATNFENVEGFELYASTFLSQHIHHQFEILRVGDVFGHDVEVVPIEQQLAEQLQ